MPNLTPQLQVAFTVEEIAQLRACCPTSAGCQHLTKLAKAVDDSPPPINEMFRGDGYDRNRSPRASGGFFPWDLVAVMAVLRRDLFSEWAPHHITVHRWQSEFTPASDDQPDEALEGHDVTMHVTVPMRVIDERAVLADALQRICRVAHVEPELIGTSALLIPSNRRFFRGNHPRVCTLAVGTVGDSLCFSASVLGMCTPADCQHRVRGCNKCILCVITWDGSITRFASVSESRRTRFISNFWLLIWLRSCLCIFGLKIHRRGRLDSL